MVRTGLFFPEKLSALSCSAQPSYSNSMPVHHPSNLTANVLPPHVCLHVRSLCHWRQTVEAWPGNPAASIGMHLRLHPEYRQLLIIRTTWDASADELVVGHVAFLVVVGSTFGLAAITRYPSCTHTYLRRSIRSRAWRLSFARCSCGRLGLLLWLWVWILGLGIIAQTHRGRCSV
jgi:hypothetical protein